MSALAVGYDPLRDKSYRLTRLGGPIVDYLASKEQLGRSAITLGDKERYLAGFAKMWPELELADVTTHHCAHWLAAQPGGSTRAMRRSHLNDFFKWALRWDYIARNPLDRLEQPRWKRQVVYDIFSAGEVAALTSLPMIDGALMLIMFDLGLRRSECIKLQSRHVVITEEDGVAKTQIRVVAGKGNKDRLVPATERCARAIAELQLLEGMEPKDHFWYAKPGGHEIKRTTPLHVSSFHQWWVRCLKDADVRYRNPHMARHTMATRWLRNGGRLETLRRILGHESIRTTEDLYSHLDVRDVARDAEIVEAHT